MDTVQIVCTLKDISTFRGVYTSDLLPTSIQSGTVIINADPHTREGSHWLAIHFNSPLSAAFYFDSYGCAPSDLNILSFLKRNRTVWSYNTSSLQGPTSVVSGHYCCLFARYMDRGITPQQFVQMFTAGVADRQTVQFFTAHFGPVCGKPRVASVASLLIHSKYLVLINRHFLSVCHGRFEGGHVGIFC